MADSNLPPDPEPGYTTTEFWLTLAGSGATLACALIVDFGVTSLNAAQKADITALAAFAVTLGIGLYSIARGIRKARS